jgi:hypothetical protein
VIFKHREPLSRALSVYYFWGELFKMRMPGRSRKNHLRASVTSNEKGKFGTLSTDRLGGGPSTSSIQGSKFVYHGDESTPPPLSIALSFATQLPYKPGMPGPSFLWSAFANSASQAISALHSESPPIVPIVAERMDYSLVVAANALAWSLADIVVVVPRKVFLQIIKLSLSGSLCLFCVPRLCPPILLSETGQQALLTS